MTVPVDPAEVAAPTDRLRVEADRLTVREYAVSSPVAGTSFGIAGLVVLVALIAGAFFFAGLWGVGLVLAWRRLSTRVDADATGVRVVNMWWSRRPIPWEEIDGFLPSEAGVYLHRTDGSIVALDAAGDTSLSHDRRVERNRQVAVALVELGQRLGHPVRVCGSGQSADAALAPAVEPDAGPR